MFTFLLGFLLGFLFHMLVFAFLLGKEPRQ